MSDPKRRRCEWKRETRRKKWRWGRRVGWWV
jgi:hypothetical protein